MFENALYYPTTDICNDAWLKTAALFWNRIETIVPESEDKLCGEPPHRYTQEM